MVKIDVASGQHHQQRPSCKKGGDSCYRHNHSHHRSRHQPAISLASTTVGPPRHDQLDPRQTTLIRTVPEPALTNKKTQPRTGTAAGKKNYSPASHSPSDTSGAQGPHTASLWAVPCHRYCYAAPTPPQQGVTAASLTGSGAAARQQQQAKGLEKQQLTPQTTMSAQQLVI